MTLRSCSIVFLWGGALAGSGWLHAQDSVPKARRFSIGVRIANQISPLFETGSATSATTKPVATYTYSATSHTPRFSGAPTAEYRLTAHFAVAAELQFRHAEYQQTTELISGVIDPNTKYDDRPTTIIKETTKANYWEVPLLVRYYGLRSKGQLHNTYVSGGLAWRHVGAVRTGTEFAYGDATTDYNEDPAQPMHGNQVGFVAAMGMRFGPVMRVTVAPELRFVHWQNRAFEGTAYHSRQNQVQFGIGFTF